MLTELKQRTAEKKARLDQLRPLHASALEHLRRYYDIELTWTSNAIEGNTLSAVETELVVDKGITIGGKPIRDHLEALDLYEAVGFVRELAGRAQPVTEFAVRSLHELVVRRSSPSIAGRYADHPRQVLTETGRHAFPSPAEVPALMGDLSIWLQGEKATPKAAFEAHRRLVDIHPFNDGNGRTARLLMNMLLIRAGYPPVAVRPDDRLAYIRALASAQAGGGTQDYDLLMFTRLDATLDDYLAFLEESKAAPSDG